MRSPGDVNTTATTEATPTASAVNFERNRRLGWRPRITTPTSYVDAAEHAESVLGADERDQYKAGRERAANGAQAVGGVDGADAATERTQTLGVNATDDGEGRAHQQSRHEHHAEGQAKDAAAVAPPRARSVHETDQIGGGGKYGHRRDADDADQDLERAEHRQQVLARVEKATTDEAAEAQPEQESDQHDAELVVRGDGEGDGEQAQPGHLVSERRKPLQREPDEGQFENDRVYRDR